jgi:type III restriction enzyme
MTQVVIENPIINSPFDEPTQHFRFTDEGITDEIIEGRRISSYFVLIYVFQSGPNGFTQGRC